MWLHATVDLHETTCTGGGGGVSRKSDEILALRQENFVQRRFCPPLKGISYLIFYFNFYWYVENNVYYYRWEGGAISCLILNYTLFQ